MIHRRGPKGSLEERQGRSVLQPKVGVTAPTLGIRSNGESQPQRGCGCAGRLVGRNPVGVADKWNAPPRVASPARQPWASCPNAVGVLLLLLFAFSSAQAHESRPAYLEIKEASPGTFSVLWRTPVLAGRRLPVALKLPDTARNLIEPITQELSDSLVERRSIAAGPNGLAGRRIEFPGLQLTITDVLVRFEMRDGTKGTTIVRPSQPWMEMAATPTRWNTAGAYSRLGIEHILTGIDHLLFVLALLIITRGGWKMVKTVTAFTVSHSITLTLATLGYVDIPQRPVEAIIALSIVFVAAEILRNRAGKPGLTERAPWVVAFAFGLMHGLGFASGLSEAGLPPAHIPTALLFFSLGVETGHFLFIGAVLGSLACVRRLLSRVPSWVDLIPPYAIGGLAMFWVIERIAAF